MNAITATGLPFLTRRNFHYEFKHLLPWSVLAGVVEGQVTSIVVAATFHASPLLVATASATPIAALLVNVFWGIVSIGRPKRRLATICGLGTAAFTAAAALAPQSELGGWLFVAAMGVAQTFMAGVVTLRTALWKHNYPPALRGRITARLQGVRMVVAVLTLAVVSFAFDRRPELYRLVYPIAALFGVAGLMILQKIHVRHERSELREIRRGRAFMSNGQPLHKRRLIQALSPRRMILESRELLKSDPWFSRYLAAQMLFGFGVQMVIPIVVTLLSQTYQRYVLSILLIVIVPKLCIFGSLRRWGRLFDRLHIARFRISVGVCAASALFAGMVAHFLIEQGHTLGLRNAAAIALFPLAARAVLQGVHQGGGSLAWNLGHLDFAGHHDAELYMSLHVTLTGLRGVFAPFAGALLSHWIGWKAWAVALCFCLIGIIGFCRLAARLPNDRARDPHGEDPSRPNHT